MGNGTHRQAQQPFSGQVAPPGDALFFQEEFQRGASGVPFAPIFGPGSQPLPARWLDWTPVGVDPDTVYRWIDVLQQKASLLVSPRDVEGYQWCGSVVRLPPIESFPWEPFDPAFPLGGAVCLLDAYAALGMGPMGLGAGPSDDFDVHNGIVVSAADLSVAGDNFFHSLGMRAAQVAGDLTLFAAYAEWPDSHNQSFSHVKDHIDTGALFRLLMVVQRDFLDPGYEYSTELIAMFSTDQGASWAQLAFADMKGFPDAYPRVIGIGATGLNNPPIDCNGMGGFNSLRIFARPILTLPPGVDGVANIFGLSPDGGRNW